MKYEDPVEITPENYKFFDQLGREIDLSSYPEKGFLIELKILIDAYIYKRLKK